MELKTAPLSGIKAICDFCRSIGFRSAESTVLQLVRDEDFPAKKTGGIWESDEGLIVEWRYKRLQRDAGIEPPKKQAKKAKK